MLWKIKNPYGLRHGILKKYLESLRHGLLGKINKSFSLSLRAHSHGYVGESLRKLRINCSNRINSQFTHFPTSVEKISIDNGLLKVLPIVDNFIWYYNGQLSEHHML